MAKLRKPIPSVELKSNKAALDIDEKVKIYFWLVIPVLALIYYISSKYSLGFYQDDEIAQYLNMIDFWSNPAVILGNNPKPGWKIFMVIPALISYDAVLIFNSFVASITVFLTFQLLRIYKIPYAFFGALLLAVQPLFFDLSFRSYSEIFSAMLIVIFLILHKKDYVILSGIIAGYVFTVRQEFGLFLFVLFIIYIFQKKYLPALALTLFPFIYDILGWVKTGNIYFVISEMLSVAGLNYQSQGFLHYFKFYIFIIGPISLLMFLVGFFGFMTPNENKKLYFRKYLLPYLIFITVFGTQLLTMINSGANPGNWRYLLHISPIAVFFATVGLNLVSKNENRGHFIMFGSALSLLTLIFLSKASDGFKFLEPEKAEYTKIIFLILAMGCIFIIKLKNPREYLNKVSILLIILATAYLAIDFKPKILSSENIYVRTTADYLTGLNKKDVYIYTNHAVFKFYSPGYRTNSTAYLPLNSENLNNAPKGSIIVWDSHYGYRPEFKSDVKIETLQADSATYRLMNQFVTLDKRFGSLVFEKIK